MTKWAKVSLIVSIFMLIALGFLLYNKKQKISITKQDQKEVSIFDQNYTEKAATNAPTAAENTNATSQLATTTESFTLEIPKLGIKAPIAINVDGNNKESYMKALENGVAHMARTAIPGTKGNSVIFGHSSYYVNKPGTYKEVFAKLDKLAVGDPISFVTKDKTITYKVTGQKTVLPNDVSVVEQGKDQQIITLITCWPPKTTTNRYIITATLQ